MGGAFVYLIFAQFKNRLRVRLGRLRKPRYAIGSLAGLAYFYFVLFGTPGRRGGGPPSMLAAVARFHDGIELAAAVLLLAIAALAWLWPGGRSPSLQFSSSEVQFLFPAPVTRRQLVAYRIVRSLLTNVLLGAFMTLIVRPRSAASGWMFFAGLSLVTSTISLHLMGVSLRRASVAAHGWAGAIRQRLALVLVAGAVTVIAAAVIGNWTTLSELTRFDDIVSALVSIGGSGLAGAVLWPFRALVALPIAESSSAFFERLPVVLILLALNFVWVLRSDTAFEEGSAAAAEKVAAIVRRGGVRVAQPKVKGTGAPFKLALTGRPETAILWKNLILIGRYASLKTFLRLLPIVIVFGVVFSRSSGGGAKLVPILCMAFASIVLLFGPQAARNDLRMDLAQLAVLKTWPISGAALLRGELLAPVAILSALVWLFIAGIVSSLGALPFLAVLPWSTRLSSTAAALMLAPGVILTQLVILNGLAVMFPAWLAAHPRAGAGFDVMGQRMLMMYGMLLALVIALLPAAAAAALVGFGIYSVTGTVPILLPAMAASLTILVGCVMAVEALGKVLDRTDVSAIDV